MGFLREFLRNPRQTGSIAASSEHVVRMMLDCVDVSRARRVVELGAGTGAVTAGLVDRLSAGATLLAVELNEDFATALRQRFSSPAVHVLNRSAAELPDMLSEHDWSGADLIVSGLPWTLMPVPEQRRTLDAIAKVLEPDGEFVTLGCLHQTPLVAGRRVKALLRERFGEVARQPVVWAAVPPMIAYRCAVPAKSVTRDTLSN